MMERGAWWAAVWEDAAQGRRSLWGGALGIALGMASIIFFGALGLGVRDGVLGRALSKLPVGTLEIRTKGGLPVGFLRFEGSERIMRPLDDAALASLAGIPGVRAVHPKVTAVFPMRGEGGKALVGRDVYTDVFATGVDRSFLADDLPDHVPFTDAPTGAVPAVVSTQLLELFNVAVAPALGIPEMAPETVVGFAFTLVLGESFSSGRTQGGTRVTVQVVGVSDRAMLLGITVPRATVERWNRQFADKPPTGFQSVYLEAEDGTRIGPISKAAEAMGYVVNQDAKVAGGLVMTLMATWLAVALLILVVAAFNVAQTLAARVQARRREIGLMRAVGATAMDVAMLVMGEAALMAVGSAVLGMALGVGGALCCDELVRRYLPRFPFQPDSLFVFPPWLLLSAVLLAVACALLGALPPARAAAAVDPVEALQG